MRRHGNLLFPDFKRDKRQREVYTLGNKIENRRRFSRFNTHLRAQYFSDEKKEGGEKCTVTDISRSGMGIRFNAYGKFNVGSTIFLEIAIRERSEPINVKGVLKQVNWRGDDLFGGIEWNGLIDVVVET